VYEPIVLILGVDVSKLELFKGKDKVLLLDNLTKGDVPDVSKTCKFDFT
jgi:hypothetical protein